VLGCWAADLLLLLLLLVRPVPYGVACHCCCCCRHCCCQHIASVEVMLSRPEITALLTLQQNMQQQPLLAYWIEQGVDVSEQQQQQQ
jgi:hypothetical protein